MRDNYRTHRPPELCPLRARSMTLDKRDEWLARTFVELADTLVADFDLIEFLSMLADRCVELLGAAEVGLVLVGPRAPGDGILDRANEGDGTVGGAIRGGPVLRMCSHRAPRFEPAARVGR